MVNPYLMHRRRAFRTGGGWTPAQLSIALWLDASDNATLFDATSGGSLPVADGAVARWEDKSGNARHFTQSTSANRPLRKVAIMQNGLDGLRFDGSNDHLLNAALSLPIAGQTWICVFKENSVVANAGILSYKPTTGNDFDGTNGKIIATGNRTSNRFNMFSNNFDYVLDQKGSNATQIPASIYTEVTGATSSSLFFNGTLVGTDTHGSLASTNAAGVLIGARYTPEIAGPYLNGDIYEMIVFPSTLSTDDRQKAEGYLAHKWGLTASLPGDHPYKINPPYL
jgi:hypothetical protein